MMIMLRHCMSTLSMSGISMSGLTISKLVKIVAATAALGVVAAGHTATAQEGGGVPKTCAPSADDDPATWTCEAVTCDVSKATRWVRYSAEYKALLHQTFHFAELRAVQLGHMYEPGTWVVAVDIDETIVNNSAYSYEQEKCGRSYTRESWYDWTKEEAAVMLPGARRFIDLVYNQGGLVVGVTNRRENEAPYTKAVLNRYGVPYELILFRGDAKDATGEKEERWENVPGMLAERGYDDTKIVMYMGDQITDFPDLDQSLAENRNGGYTDFGVSYFVLPNPMYGSWEGDGH